MFRMWTYSYNRATKSIKGNNKERKIKKRAVLKKPPIFLLGTYMATGRQSTCLSQQKLLDLLIVSALHRANKISRISLNAVQVVRMSQHTPIERGLSQPKGCFGLLRRLITHLNKLFKLCHRKTPKKI